MNKLFLSFAVASLLGSAGVVAACELHEMDASTTSTEASMAASQTATPVAASLPQPSAVQLRNEAQTKRLLAVSDSGSSDKAPAKLAANAEAAPGQR